ncbi:2-dehydro-3-deoxyphosphogluconate aldolase/(4S)-4-hydroxy-2-oxoglutarate aldolase [Pullulanibacillus pueri]|uniref:2-dehydro-3-deoxy-phosphogluconate aldolase n=1 Tax=Pullulanibacillus pueri TaxID=1437324 RepID=A0A8J3ER18_9BACL|nr:bifunctional 4-hydroxy-2-oxoglutarate aldolase/2-dehydro-3-deoxy-phosphogluconate aldolase [Pullulanibacillus pueri]MBM7683415.1 2-dehydro-3-deoxyphosphogluconate aldolase/(4S)-4-hydroxy-2-oxoglutarate aldolase [Pullulanibacillus pueri]GGH88057.1 2-dehydro-3-deoxy-phosphogluconate aldolase [Pullulanibacillus pueri]
MNTLQTIFEQKLVAVIRGTTQETILPTVQALKDGGVNILEITAETPGFLAIIEKVKHQFGQEVLVGAGTVLDPETARAAIMAGAEFIFSPTVNSETIRITKRYGKVSIPGAMTPTEILSAYEQGADLIKVFPANIMGPRYLKDVHGPLPHIPLMPTGGVGLDNIREYFDNGAVAAGLGSALVNTKALNNEDGFRELKEKAAQFRAKIS